MLIKQSARLFQNSNLGIRMGEKATEFAKRIVEEYPKLAQPERSMYTFCKAYLKLESENKRLREALQWYADKTNYEHWRNGNPPELMFLKILHGDDGERARKALGSINENCSRIKTPI